MASLPADTPFTVPDGYFSEFYTDIQSLITIEQQAALQETETVPDGYFEAFPQQILAMAKESAEEFSLPAGRKNVFSAPESGYFEAFSANILNVVKQPGAAYINEVQKELQELSPVLAALPKENVFTVPAGFFDSFTVQKQQAKVVRMAPVRALRYAAAAMIAGIIAISIFFINGNNGNNNNYSSAVIKEAQTIIQQNSFDETLNSLSDGEIERYLLAKGTDIDAAIVASSALENTDSLPSPIDYIMDENTLTNYLKDLNIEN